YQKRTMPENRLIAVLRTGSGKEQYGGGMIPLKVET
ncbi:unnamed protein product, partial [marine sediment metagenome]